MSARLTETLIGLLVLIFAGLALTYALTRSGSVSGGEGGYTLYADFQDASGLRLGTEVEIAGVRVGEITSIELTDFYYARVAIGLGADVVIPEDAELAWRQSDLLGAPRLSILVFDETGAPLQDGDFFGSVDPADNFFEVLSNLAASGGE